MSRFAFSKFAALVVTIAIHSSAWACPMCSTAVQEGQNQALPEAFYYSILFMLSMPFLLFAGFSAAFYRMAKMNASTTPDANPPELNPSNV